jgi:hypothetical protein
VSLHPATATGSIAGSLVGSAAASGALLLILAAVTLGYLLACWLYPFIACRRCRGTGKRRSLFGGHTFGLCRRCDGTGRQLRPGRRALNYLRVLHDRYDTTRHTTARAADRAADRARRNR